MAKETYKISDVVGARTRAIGQNTPNRFTRSDAIINVGIRARNLRNQYGAGNAARINAAGRRMVEKLL